jgi:hypothetical protein
MAATHSSRTGTDTGNGSHAAAAGAQEARPAAHGWLPGNSVLVHIGPPKTGTTAIQTALTAAQESLAEQGVLYPVSGPRTQHARPAASLLGRRLAGSADVESPKSWASLVAQISRRDDRAVISSELFADADDSHIGRIATDLGHEDVRVLITLRPLESLLASTWQQDLKGGRPQDFESWLRERLAEPGDHVFWKRNRHDQLVARWAAGLSPDRVSVLIVDSGRPDHTLRATESVIGVAPDTLAPQYGNRSLSQQEAEFLRAFQTRLGGDQDRWAAQRWLRQGAFKAMVENRSMGSHELRIATPAWAVERAREIHTPMIESILAQGVHVVGDPGVLLARAEVDPPDERVIDLRDPVATAVPLDAAVELAVGLFEAAQRDYVRLQADLASHRERAGALAATAIGRRGRSGLLQRAVRRVRRRTGR